MSGVEAYASWHHPQCWSIRCITDHWLHIRYVSIIIFLYFILIFHLVFSISLFSFFGNVLLCSLGRRTALILTAVSAGVAGLIRSFSTGYIMYLVLEFVDATVGSGVYSTGFILGTIKLFYKFNFFY